MFICMRCINVFNCVMCMFVLGTAQIVEKGEYFKQCIICCPSMFSVPNEKKILYFTTENFTLLQKLYFTTENFTTKSLLHEKYFFSTKLKPFKIPFSIRKLTIFLILISIDVLEND